MAQLERIAKADLERVARLSDKAVQAVALRDEAIQVAYGNGHPLRKIADAAGVSHETVRRICSK